MGDAIATGGNLVFYGNMEGWFKAVHAETGEVLWQFKTGSGIIGQPTTFLGPDGRQYVAILSGVGGWAGAVVSADLDPTGRTAAKASPTPSRAEGGHDQVAFAFWVYLFGGARIRVAFSLNVGADTGWFSYVPCLAPNTARASASTSGRR